MLNTCLDEVQKVLNTPRSLETNKLPAQNHKIKRPFLKTVQHGKFSSLKKFVSVQIQSPPEQNGNSLRNAKKLKQKKLQPSRQSRRTRSKNRKWSGYIKGTLDGKGGREKNSAPDRFE